MIAVAMIKAVIEMIPAATMSTHHGKGASHCKSCAGLRSILQKPGWQSKPIPLTDIATVLACVLRLLVDGFNTLPLCASTMPNVLLKNHSGLKSLGVYITVHKGDSDGIEVNVALTSQLTSPFFGICTIMYNLYGTS